VDEKMSVLELLWAARVPCSTLTFLLSPVLCFVSLAPQH